MKMQLCHSDYLKLLSNNDLNDTIIDNFLKIISNYLLPSNLTGKVYSFSTFLLSKLLKEIL